MGQSTTGAHDQYENTQLEKSKKINSGQIFLIFIIAYQGTPSTVVVY